MIIKSKPFKITTKRPNVESISVSSSSIKLTSIGQTYMPQVTFQPSTVVDRKLYYKSENESIARVSSDGLITAIAEGTTNIVITSASGSKQAKIRVVVDVATQELSVNTSEYTFSNLNQTIQLIATFSDNVNRSAITWSSTNESVASVDSTGFVTSKSVGECQIIARSGDLVARTSIMVRQIVTSIKLHTYKVDVNVGETVKLSPTVLPENATDTTLIWATTNGSVATVSSTGVITGVGGGSCIVSVTPVSNPIVMSSVAVNVQSPPTGITVDVKNLSFTRQGEVKQVRATVTPENASNTTVTWSTSNSNVATVDSNGNITSVGNGSCTITAKNSKGHSATVNVTVSIEATNISLNQTNVTLTRVSQAYTLVATVTPSNAHNKTVTWSSSNTNVATVSSSGVLTAKTNGTTTITAKTNNGKTTTALVTVNIPCESVSLNQTSINAWKIGQQYKISATASPNAIVNPTFSWTSTNTSVATVDSTGTVVITGFGEAKIKASYGGKEGVCNVVSKVLPVEKVTLSATKCTFTKTGQTFQIVASVTPSNATYTNLSYNITSENAGFSVDNKGLVTCTGILGGTIEVVAHNGVKATFSVFTEAINVTIGDYSEKLESLREAMQKANEKIAQQKTDAAKNNLVDQIANLSSKINKEIDDLDASLSNIRDNVLEGIEDGVLTDIEKARIESSLDSLRAEKVDVDAEYQELYNNTYLVDSGTNKPKTSLAQAYSTYSTAYTALTSEIEGMLLLSKINEVHKNMYTVKLQNCINAYQTFKRYTLIAIDSIAQRRESMIRNDLTSYTDSRIQVESDRITSTVSAVTQMNGQVTNLQSQITVLAGEITSKVDSNGISSVIQQSPNAVKIAFNGISSGLTVTASGMELKVNGAVHSILRNGRLEVMKTNGVDKVGYVGRNTWSGTSIEGLFLDTSTGCTIGLGVNSVMGVVYSRNNVQTPNSYVYAGFNVFTHAYFHNNGLYGVGAIATSQVSISSNYVSTPIVKATSQIQAQTVHIYDWCQAKKYITYTDATYQTRSGETKSITIEKACVDAITANTEYIGTSEIINGECIVELPIELQTLGSSYVVQVSPIGDKKVFVSEKNTDNIVVKGDDCEFDYVIKVMLPQSRSIRRVLSDEDFIDDVNIDPQGIDPNA